MKPIVKQKVSTLQDIINKAQAGGGTVDAYTKAEADAKFETKTDAATTYLSKSDAANMVNKQSAEGTINKNTMYFNFSIADLNSFTNAIVIFILKNNSDPELLLSMCIIALISGQYVYISKADGSYDTAINAVLVNQTLTLEIQLVDDFRYIYDGTAEIIY